MKINDIPYLDSKLKNDTLFKGWGGGGGDENLIAKQKPSLNHFHKTLRDGSVLTDS